MAIMSLSTSAASSWLLVICLALAAVMFTYTILISRRRKLRPGEPPIVKGSLLWGSAVDFSRNAVHFLHRCTAQYGEVFTMRLLSQHLTIIMDPHSFESFSREKRFDFDPIQKQVNHNVFGFAIKDKDHILHDTSRTIRGPGVGKSAVRFAGHLDRILGEMNLPVSSSSASQGESHLLREFLSHTMFEAQFCTMFGQTREGQQFTAKATFPNLELFHQYFNYLWLGLPLKLFPAAGKALKAMLHQPSAEEIMQREDASDYVRTAIRLFKEAGQTDYDIMAHNLVYVHVNFNTFRLAYWAIHNFLVYDTARAAILAEINALLQDKLDDNNTATISVKDVENLKILGSFVDETSRLASGVFMVRGVTEDTQFITSSGQQFLIRAGDRVAIYPPAHHKDPEIFEDPLTFKYDRFVDATFYKNGKPLTHPVMAFGSLCPGKRYALTELKWFILQAIVRLDMELVGGEKADYDFQYYGHEVLPPVKDVRILVRTKATYPTLHIVSG